MTTAGTPSFTFAVWDLVDDHPDVQRRDLGWTRHNVDLWRGSHPDSDSGQGAERGRYVRDRLGEPAHPPRRRGHLARPAENPHHPGNTAGSNRNITGRCPIDAWRSSRAHLVRDEEAIGSNPVTPTTETPV